MKYEKATNVGSKIQSNTTKIENLLGELRLVSRMLAQKEFTKEATSICPYSGFSITQGVDF